MEFDYRFVGYILSDIEELSPEGRFLLLCLLYEYSVESKEIDISVEQLVSKYGVTRTVCSEVSKFLSLPKNKLAQIRRTKVRYCEFDSVSLSKLSSDFDNGQYGNVHRFTIVDLLTKKSKLGCAKNECDLSVSNLLLLIILLIHSDSSGSVERLSKAKIRKMMGGISSDRLKSQLKKLSEMEYVFISQSGGTGRKLFGKTPNNYLLNLGEIKTEKYHPDKKEKASSASLFAPSVLEQLEIFIRDIQYVRHIDGKTKDKDLNALFALFGDDVNASMGITNLIINKCESIISVLLSECWDEVDSLDLKKCNFLKRERMELLLTRSSLFSMSFNREYFIFDDSTFTGKKGIEEKKKAEDKFKAEVIVTPESFKQWLDNQDDDISFESQTHRLVVFLIQQSLYIAIKMKCLFVHHFTKFEKPDSINVIFNRTRMNGTVGDSYHVTVTLLVKNQFKVYLIDSQKLVANDIRHVISVKSYSRKDIPNVRVI